VPLRIRGAGTWMDAGRPVDATQHVALDGLSGIIDYEPGDLTLTAYAGTTLAEIADVTGPERQWLTFDPPGTDAGTIGATVATASAGPMSHAFGLPRDAVLGVEAVTGEGQLVRGGGRVVKNVAGFDLTRLFVGSWGTLGILTEVTVRLRARPDVDETYVLPASALDHVRRAAVAPLAVELLNAALASRLSLGNGDVLLVRLAGNAASVDAQRLELGGDRVPTHIWSTLRATEPPGAPAWRYSAQPARFAALWSALPSDVLAHATPARGVVRCIGTLSALKGQATVIGERLPAEAWPALAPARTRTQNAAYDRLSKEIKKSFDPFSIFNPGILG